MKVHVIAIGGSIMHSLAIQLKLLGYDVTGSDDTIHDPALSNLKHHNLLPEEGWYPERITEETELVVVGKHAHADNPELIKARTLGIKTQSFPEFVYERSLDKKRIAVAGSHGKTTTTSMVMHLFKTQDRNFDYLVGAEIPGFERSFKLTATAPYIVLEADEYPTSALDPRPKFFHYKAHYSIITGIAWDHMNVFPTEENYIKQFEEYLAQLSDGTHVIYNELDPILNELVNECDHIVKHPYQTMEYEVRDGKFYLTESDLTPLNIIGKHNVENLSAVKKLAGLLEISDETFYSSFESYFSPSKRLERIVEGEDRSGFFDFAHAPSKVKASINAVKQLNPDRKCLALVELHTYSSLNKAFLKNYQGALDQADEIIVFYSPETLKIKRLEALSESIIREEFGRSDISVFEDRASLLSEMESKNYANTNLLVMTSGSIDKTSIRDWIRELLS